MNKILIFSLLLSLVACSGRRKADLGVTDEVDTPNRVFDQGLSELDRENYAEAARIFDSLLVQKPATEFGH